MKETTHLKTLVDAWGEVGYLQNKVVQRSKVNYTKFNYSSHNSFKHNILFTSKVFWLSLAA